MASVYIVQAGGAAGPVKIGTTRASVEKRIRNLQTAHPEILTCRREIDGGVDLERAFHVKFNHLRLRPRSEWFAFSTEMLTVQLAPMAPVCTYERASFAAIGSHQRHYELRKRAINSAWKWFWRAYAQRQAGEKGASFHPPPRVYVRRLMRGTPDTQAAA